MKKVYEAPALVELGAFEEMTQGGVSGGALDATFEDGTPFDDLTFS
jgi:hypothetical protein